MQSKAPTVAKYLAELPPERRAEVERVRKVFRENLDPGFREGMGYGMIAYSVPLETYPIGYHCDPKLPLGFAGLAAQKNGYSFYLMCLYGDAKREKEFRDAWAKTGKKLDMGKACVRFKSADDVALDVLAKTLRSVSMKSYIASYEKMLGTERIEKARKAAARIRPGAFGGTRSTAPVGKPKAKATAKPARKSSAKKTARKTAKRVG